MLYGTGICVITAALAVATGLSGQTFQLPAELDGHISRNGLATFLSAGPEGLRVHPRTGRALSTPRDFLVEYGHLFGIADPGDELLEQDSEIDELGMSHRNYQQMFRGVPVFSGGLHVRHMNQAFSSANGRIHRIPAVLNPVPVLTLDDAVAAATAHLQPFSGVLFDSELVIVDPGWWGGRSSGPRLAYRLSIDDPGRSLPFLCFVDATTGAILDRWDLADNANIQVFNGFPGFNAPARSTANNAVNANADVNRGFDFGGDTADYYLRGFNRNSIDGRGLAMVASVNTPVQLIGSNCPNAFFVQQGFGRGPQTVFCAGLATDDIVGHEFTHGVTAFSARLIYKNQPGQLNESFSDVFGELVDLFNGNAAFAGAPAPPNWPLSNPLYGAGRVPPTGRDVPNNARGACSLPPAYADGVRWLIGEDTNNAALIRDMFNPACYIYGGTARPYPDKATSLNYGCNPAVDSGNVHMGSSVPNHAFALLTDGGVFNGQNVAGIGPIKAGAVWYRALTRYLTPASNFVDAYNAFNQAATDLVNVALRDPRTGVANVIFTAADKAEVDKALRAVELNIPVACNAAGLSVVYVVDTTGSAAGVLPFYNFVAARLTALLSQAPVPIQFALARFDDYPCAPSGQAGDVPYQAHHTLRHRCPAPRLPAGDRAAPRRRCGRVADRCHRYRPHRPCPRAGCRRMRAGRRRRPGRFPSRRRTRTHHRNTDDHPASCSTCRRRAGHTSTTSAIFRLSCV